jgi:hypothetical protein
MSGTGRYSTIDRTQAWRKFEMECVPNSTKYWIDGTLVRNSPNAYPFNFVSMWMSGPTWRPAWVSYWDDFQIPAYSAVVPEPMSLAMLGIAGLPLMRQRRRQA